MKHGNDPEIMPGDETTFQSYGVAWANLSNAPFREYKHFVHEGGIATPLIAHWPKGIESKGGAQGDGPTDGYHGHNRRCLRSGMPDVQAGSPSSHAKGAVCDRVSPSKDPIAPRLLGSMKAIAPIGRESGSSSNDGIARIGSFMIWMLIAAR